jgi:hypothetical protein
MKLKPATTLALAAIRDGCEKLPMLRIGQLISNALYGIDTQDYSHIFYVTDEELANKVNDYIKMNTKDPMT